MAVRFALWVFAGVIVSAGAFEPDWSSAQARDRNGVLEQVGELHCAVRRAKGAPTTKLTCNLRLSEVKGDQGTFEGEMFDEGLYLVVPGETQVVWKVLAPSPVDADALEGDYDIVSKHRFQYEQKNRNLLIGGLNDMVALELTAPAVDPITASTRLTLRKTS